MPMHVTRVCSCLDVSTDEMASADNGSLKCKTTAQLIYDTSTMVEDESYHLLKSIVEPTGDIATASMRNRMYGEYPAVGIKHTVLHSVSGHSRLKTQLEDSVSTSYVKQAEISLTSSIKKENIGRQEVG